MEIAAIFVCAVLAFALVAGLAYGVSRLFFEQKLARIRRERARDRRLLSKFVHSSVEVFEARLTQHSEAVVASNGKVMDEALARFHKTGEEYKQHFDFLCDDTVAKAEAAAARREEDYQAVAKAYFALTGKDVVNPPKDQHKPMGLNEKRLAKERNLIAKEKSGGVPRTR